MIVKFRFDLNDLKIAGKSGQILGAREPLTADLDDEYEDISVYTHKK